MGLQYWVVYAFLTVVESAISAVYWFPFSDTFKFVVVMWLALPQTGYVIFATPRIFAVSHTDQLVAARKSCSDHSSSPSLPASSTSRAPLLSSCAARQTGPAASFSRDCRVVNMEYT